MRGDRATAVAACVLAIAVLFDDDELTGISMQFAGDGIDFLIRTASGQDILAEALLIYEENPLQVAVDAFGRVQDYLAENGPTRGQARPACRTGHAHPAICQVRDDAVALVCPADLSILRPIHGS